MKIVKRKLSELKNPEKNVRRHTPKQIDEFIRSIKMFGQIRPIVIDENDVILAGNGLHEALIKSGAEEADCYIASGLTENEKKKLMLADNRIFDLGVDDIDVFDQIIAELEGDLDIPGYDDDFLESLIMDDAETTEALSEYGRIDESDAERMRSAATTYDTAAEQRPAPTFEAPAASVSGEIPSTAPVPYSQPASANDGRPYVICPKCGERIWL